jgi:hypothetical protein
MDLGNIEISLDERQITQIIEKKIDDNIRQSLLFIDINRLAEITTFSRSTLEKKVLHDERMKLIERRLDRKRVWYYKEAMEVLREMADESW